MYCEGQFSQMMLIACRVIGARWQCWLILTRLGHRSCYLYNQCCIHVSSCQCYHMVACAVPLETWDTPTLCHSPRASLKYAIDKYSWHTSHFTQIMILQLSLKSQNFTFYQPCLVIQEDMAWYFEYIIKILICQMFVNVLHILLNYSHSVLVFWYLKNSVTSATNICYISYYIIPIQWRMIHCLIPIQCHSTI